MNLTQDPIPELIRKIAIPASIGYFFNTMYNVVDTYYAGMVSTEALAALSLSFPVFFILIAFAAGISQGATALISNALGEGSPEKARQYAVQAVVFGLALSVVIMGVGFWAAPHLFQLLGAKAEYLNLTLTYMNTLLAATAFFLAQQIINASLTAQGNTHTFRNLLIAGFLANVILDPWFMNGGFGLPAMGVRGIALATVVIQITGTFYLGYRALKSRLFDSGSIRSEEWKPNRNCFIEIAHQGFPASLNMMTVALGIFIITWFISDFGPDGVAAYGVATRVEQILLLPTIGLNVAVMTLSGQNNGAGRLDRVRDTWLTGLKYGFWMTLVGGVALWISSEWMMRRFTESEPVILHGTQYLKIAAITLFSYVILYQTVFMLQGMKQPMYAIWVGLYRQIIAPAVVFYFFTKTLGWGLSGIWWGIFLVTWSAAVFTAFYGNQRLRTALNLKLKSQSPETLAS